MRYCVIPVVVALLSLAALRADEPSPADKLLQGVWRVKASVEGDVETLFSGELQDAVFVFNKDTLTVVTRQNKIYKGAFVAAPGKGDAFTLDFVWNDKKVQGILAPKKSGVVLCFDKSGKERPASFQIDSERPHLALGQLEKLGADTILLAEKETKWIRGFAEDFLTSLVKGNYLIIHGFLNVDDYGKRPEGGSWRPDRVPFVFRRDPETGKQVGQYAYVWEAFDDGFKTYSIDNGTLSPSKDEVVFRGTFSTRGGKLEARYTLRLKQEVETKRWSVANLSWDFVRDHKDK